MDLKKTNQMSDQIKSIFVEAISSSTCHGIANIIRSPSLFIKIMWIVFVFISTGLFGFMIFDNIVSYLKYEVSTKTRVITEYQPLFPTITICNINFLTSKYASESIEMYKQNFKNYDPLSDSLKFDQISKILETKTQDEIKKLGDSIEKLILDCSYEYKKCNFSQFKYFFHPYYGNCYQFNSGYDSNGSKINLVKSIVTERIFTLKLTLNVSIDDGLKFVNPNLGVVLLIHNQTTYPTMVDEITIAPKKETNIGLTRTFYKSQPYPFSYCDGNTNDMNSFDSEYFKLVHEKTNGYNQILCVYQCFQKLIIDRCNCQDQFLPSFYSANSCSIFSECLNQNSNAFIDENCYEKCPLECEGMWFDKTISISEYLNPSFIERLANYMESDNRNKSINSTDLAVVNIFYQSLNYVSKSENPTVTKIGLVSNIGGIASLFLGVSLLSFVELVDIFFRIIFLMKKNNKINR